MITVQSCKNMLSVYIHDNCHKYIQITVKLLLLQTYLTRSTLEMKLHNITAKHSEFSRRSILQLSFITLLKASVSDGCTCICEKLHLMARDTYEICCF